MEAIDVIFLNPSRFGRILDAKKSAGLKRQLLTTYARAKEQFDLFLTLLQNDPAECFEILDDRIYMVLFCVRCFERTTDTIQDLMSIFPSYLALLGRLPIDTCQTKVSAVIRLIEELHFYMDPGLESKFIGQALTASGINLHQKLQTNLCQRQATLSSLCDESWMEDTSMQGGRGRRQSVRRAGSERSSVRGKRKGGRATVASGTQCKAQPSGDKTDGDGARPSSRSLGHLGPGFFDNTGIVVRLMCWSNIPPGLLEALSSGQIDLHHWPREGEANVAVISMQTGGFLMVDKRDCTDVKIFRQGIIGDEWSQTPDLGALVSIDGDLPRDLIAGCRIMGVDSLGHEMRQTVDEALAMLIKHTRIPVVNTNEGRCEAVVRY